jgi:hypothetical protein
MSPTQSPPMKRSRSRAPSLRLLHGQNDQRLADPSSSSEPLRGRDASPPALRVVDGPTRVLLAGTDTERRAALLDELTQTLSTSTVFEQADAVSEALEHASGSRMAFITGDLEDAPAESLMRMLAHRHPELPVLIVDGPTRNAGGHIAARHGELRTQYA